jgi:hypothetical protein
MPVPSRIDTTASCACGSVELAAIGAPIRIGFRHTGRRWNEEKHWGLSIGAAIVRLRGGKTTNQKEI